MEASATLLSRGEAPRSENRFMKFVVDKGTVSEPSADGWVFSFMCDGALWRKAKNAGLKNAALR